jgi:DNA primase
MNLKAWEATIQQIVAESNQEPKEFAKHRILTAWRAKLEKESTSLLPFQIDQIVREVRKRLPDASR